MIEFLNEHWLYKLLLWVAAAGTAVVAVMTAFVEGRKKLKGFLAVLRIIFVDWMPWGVSRQIAKMSVQVVSFSERQESMRKDFEERWRSRAKEMEEMKADLVANRDAWATVKKELQTNSWGSLKDAHTLFLAFMKQTIRERPYPSFMCDGEGSNIVVSRAYLTLLGLGSQKELSAYDWRRWLFNEDLEQYFDAFVMAAKERSAFRGTARWVDRHGKDLGRWEVTAEVMIESDDFRLLYMGMIRPICDLARETARRFGFEYPR